MNASIGILVADDEPQLLRVVVRVLERNGYPVLRAATGDEAIKAFGTAPDQISVVILDGAIEPNGAHEVLSSIVEKRPDVGVVLTSGDRLDDALRELMLEYNGIFLRKPFPPAGLLRAVKESLGQSSAARVTAAR